MEININYVAVLVAAISSMVVGALWYSPLLFGKMWMKMLGKTEEEIKKEGGASTGYIVAGISSLLASYILAHFVDYTGATDILGGVTTAFWAWLGFVVTTHAVITSFENRKWGIYMISVFHHLVSFLVMGAILAVWV